MTLTDRVGFAKYLFNVGKEYGDLLRGSITPSAAVAVVANYFGLSKPASLAVGACLVPVTMLVAVCAGFLVVRWRIVHATIEHEWENNPYEKAHIDTLREIRDRLPRPTPHVALHVCSYDWLADGSHGCEKCSAIEATGVYMRSHTAEELR